MKDRETVQVQWFEHAADQPPSVIRLEHCQIPITREDPSETFCVSSGRHGKATGGRSLARVYACGVRVPKSLASSRKNRVKSSRVSQDENSCAIGRGRQPEWKPSAFMIRSNFKLHGVARLRGWDLRWKPFRQAWRRSLDPKEGPRRCPGASLPHSQGYSTAVSREPHRPQGVRTSPSSPDTTADPRQRAGNLLFPQRHSSRSSHFPGACCRSSIRQVGSAKIVNERAGITVEHIFIA